MSYVGSYQQSLPISELLQASKVVKQLLQASNYARRYSGPLKEDE